MNILFATSEVHPFLKTGGLADVSSVLPREIAKSGHQVKVVMPLYAQIPNHYKKLMWYVGYFYVDLGAQSYYVGLWEIQQEGVSWFFLDNEAFFYRDKPYGQEDDGLRFAYFAKACCQLISYMNWDIDIVHANDWFCGLLPLYIKDFAKGDGRYKDIRSLMTIHNITYQGVFGFDVFEQTGLSFDYFHEEGVKFYQGLNYMKAGIVYADAVSTVSKTYAKELTFPFYGGFLAGLLRKYEYKLTGIQNGIDIIEYDPMTDPYIKQNYNFGSIDKKIENKRDLQERLGLEKKDVPLITMVARLVDIKGVYLVLAILEELLQEDIQFVVLGTGEARAEEAFARLAARYPKKMSAQLYFSNEESHRVYAGGDFFLVPSETEPSGLSQMIAMHYGNIPIVRETGGLKDTVVAYNKFTGQGRGYRFLNINAHELLFTIKEALGNYGTKVHMGLVKEAMEEDFSWNQAKEEYLALYRSLMENK